MHLTRVNLPFDHLLDLIKGIAAISLFGGRWRQVLHKVNQLFRKSTLHIVSSNSKAQSTPGFMDLLCVVEIVSGHQVKGRAREGSRVVKHSNLHARKTTLLSANGHTSINESIAFILWLQWIRMSFHVLTALKVFMYAIQVIS